jgi:hypothetical protein
MHIGPPKTGTTYIQDTLRGWHEELREAGILYPTRPPRIHFFAALDARGNLGHGIQVGVEEHERTQAAGAWSALVKTVKAFDGVSIISHEVFASADDEHAEAAIRDLAGVDLHLVVTARDPARQIMSAWQQRIRQGSQRTFATVAGAVTKRKALSQGQDIAGLLGRWGQSLAPDHVHVVTVPPSGSNPTLLWQRFAEAVGIDSGRFAASEAARSNEALSWAETEALRRVNVALDGRIGHPAYSEIVGRLFAREIMSGISGSAKAALPSDLAPLAADIAEHWIDVVQTKGYHVVGDLEDLRPQAADAGSSQPTEAAIAEVALKASAELLIELERRRSETSEPSQVARAKRAAVRGLRRMGVRPRRTR